MFCSIDFWQICLTLLHFLWQLSELSYKMNVSMCDISICCHLCTLNVNKKPSGNEALFSSFASHPCVLFLLLLSQHSYCGMISHISSRWDKGAVFEIRTLVKTSVPMRLAVNYEFSVFLCAPSRSCGLSSRWWKRGRRGMFMKTQQTPISLSSGIWCVTLSAILVCFVFLCKYIWLLDFSLVFGIQALL